MEFKISITALVILILIYGYLQAHVFEWNYRWSDERQGIFVSIVAVLGLIMILSFLIGVWNVS